MENTGNKKRLAKWLCAWTCSLVVLSGSFCLATEDEPTAGELLKKSMKQMRTASKLPVGSKKRAEKNSEAVDTMAEYLSMTIETTAGGVIEIAQDIRFRRISLLIELNRLEDAVIELKIYIDKPLGEHPRRARSLRATCLFELAEFEECTTAVTHALLYNEDPESNAGRKPLTPDEEERYAKYEKKDYELEYTDEAVTALYVTMAEAYYQAGNKWNECIEPYTYVSEHTKDPHQKGYVLMQIINAMVAIPDFDRIAEFIPALYRTPARYDILVNLALMDVAAALFDLGEDNRTEGKFRKAEKNYNDALPLYRMILPREELLAYQRQKLRDLRIEKKMAAEAGMEIPDDEKALLGIEDEPEMPEEEADAEAGLAKNPPEVRKLENLILHVEDLEPYEINIKYRMAQIYEKVGRFWEAVEFLAIIYEKDPESRIGEFAIHRKVKILLQEIGALAEAEECGFAYLDKQKTGMTARQIAYLFTGYYHKKNDMEAVKSLRPYLDGFVRADDDENVYTDNTLASIVKYDAELYYMQAVADLVQYKFNDSAVGFQLVLDEFPDSHQEDNSLYWLGMSKLFLTKFDEAYKDFELYGQKFPEEKWVDEAAYQGGVCKFGLEDYKAASNRFLHVIATYPDPDPDPDTGKMPKDYSSTFPEANTMLGDLLGASSRLREAEACYRVAIKHATKPAQATTAVFQLAKIFKAEDDYDGSIRLVEAYLEQWKEEADIAKALFWIGKSKLQKRALVEKKDKVLADKLLVEVVAGYLAAIVEYGTDVQQDGVDMMIEELANIANVWLDFDAQNELLGRMKEAGEATSSTVLKLRLRVAVAMITNTESELGRRLLAELSDFESIPPPVLATICKVSFEDKDYSRAKELLDIFEAKFEDSELVRGAYKLRTRGQLVEEDYDGALETIGAAKAFFLEDNTGMEWAQLMKAQALLENGEFELAISNNFMVIGVSAWRGEPVAQATYQIAQVEERIALNAISDGKREKHLHRAAAYYQRVYMQYKGYADGYWAVEAYLDSARCLGVLGRENDRRNTLRALLFDPFVNTLPQADVARKELGAVETAEIEAKNAEGNTTNIAIHIEMDESESGAKKTKAVEGEVSGDNPGATGGGKS